jgi:hypothetical protein
MSPAVGGGADSQQSPLEIVIPSRDFARSGGLAEFGRGETGQRNDQGENKK